MNSSMISVRRALVVAASVMFAAMAALAADTQVTGQVTVQAERPASKVVGRSASGMPIVLASVQYRVNYSDLDVSVPSNAEVFKTRVRDAARAACADLDKLNAQPASAAECSQKAEDRAMPQVLSAIAAAEARKAAAD